MQQFPNALNLKPNQRCLTSRACWGLGSSTVLGAAPSPTSAITVSSL
ncbi:uncharacterized protein J3R85_002009 [Psidium guajava]|nr:uncharacterized protein J3R85_002009 [Psidium guajava]